MASVPRTLTDLLSGLIDIQNISSAEAYKDVDRIIVQDHWAREFQNYLKKRSLEEEEQTFRFLVLTEIVLQYETLLAKQRSKNNAKMGEKLKAEQRQVFYHIVVTFFAEDSEEQIALSNQKLFELLSSYSENVEGERNLTEEMLNHLKRAQKDSNVWSEGLEPIYVNFLKQTNTSTNPIACLLSIL